MAIPVTLDVDIAVSAPEPDALRAVRAYGSHSLAYSALQRSVRFFELPNSGGIAYRKYLGHHMVLGDPLCSESSANDLIDAFIESHERPVFAQIGRETADILAARGFQVTPLGCDTEVDVQDFSLTGHSKRDLRRARNRAERSGLSVTEARDCEALRFELKQLSNRWISTRSVKRRELSFLVRPLAFEPESGVRIFIANQGARLHGFVIFDPRYRVGCNVGYTASILRTEPDAPAGTVDFILLSAIEQLRREGVQSLSLGVMPFHNLDEAVITKDVTARPLFKLLRIIARRDCAPFLNISGLNFHKSRYCPRTEPVYLAAKSSSGLLPMTLLTRACGLLP